MLEGCLMHVMNNVRGHLGACATFAREPVLYRHCYCIDARKGDVRFTAAWDADNNMEYVYTELERVEDEAIVEPHGFFGIMALL